VEVMGFEPTASTLRT